MKLDLNLTITGIIALCAIISPILTSIIDNMYKLKAKKMDVYETGRINALNDFINCTFNCINYFDGNSNSDDIKVKIELLREYYKSYHKLITFFPNINLKDVDAIGAQITSGEYGFIANKLYRVVIDLSKQIEPKHKLLIKNIFHK